MPRLTLIYPCIGRFPGDKYVRSWQMQPLVMALLKSLTPPDWTVTLFDDRLEAIDFDQPTDLVAISLETYTARRGYQIAQAFRARGVPVVAGGYHATACPEEVLEHVDAVCVGEVEGVWSTILADAKNDCLRGTYKAQAPPNLSDLKPDRSIFAGKSYFKMALVETGRGCPFTCNFCSITAFHNATYRRRPVADVIDEIMNLKEDIVFFVDDNMVGDLEGAKELFRALIPLKIRWMSQASINMTRSQETLDLMAQSGCMGVLVGFESLDPATLEAMDKGVNRAEEFSDAMNKLRQAGIAVYGTFVFGYPHDAPDCFERAVAFALQQKLFIGAFNHLIPFPGTHLYRELQAEGRLDSDRWWLEEDYRFGDVPFRPASMAADEIEQRCHIARRAFYNTGSILRRALDTRANCSGLRRAQYFFGINFLMQREVAQKRGIPLGVRDGSSP